MSLVIEEAKKHVVVPSSRFTADHLRHMEQRMNAFLPVEQEAKTRAEQEYVKARDGLRSAHLTQELGYPMLGLEPLSWTNKGKHGILYPKLALVSFSNPNFVVEARSNSGSPWSRFPSADLPEKLRTAYEPAARSLRQYVVARPWRESAQIQFTFSGVIPDETRVKIADALATFGREMYMLVDAPVESWKLSTERKERPRLDLDPLVVGFRHDRLFLIDSFDPTPIEKYIEMEFTATKQLTA